MKPAEADLWEDLLRQLPADVQDIFSSPRYLFLYQQLGLGTAECFVYEEGDHYLLYPYLRSPLASLDLIPDAHDYFDIQGAYGYNGPLTNYPDKEFLGRFSEEFKAYCRREHIIAEFTRFNPVFANHVWLPHAEVIKANDVVNVDLTPHEDLIWSQSFERDVRRIINKGRENGYWDRTLLLAEAGDHDLMDFTAIYTVTMSRKQAEEFYYFNQEFFQKIKDIMGGNVLISIVYDGEKPIGASLNPFQGSLGYGFLGGSLKEYRKISPFTFMMHRLILKLKALGAKNFLLGGGSVPGDGIFAYKKSFDVNGVLDFYIGKCIHNPEIYDALCMAWEMKYPEKQEKYGHYVLKYRF